MHRQLISIFKSAVASVNPANLVKSGVMVEKAQGKIEIFGNVFSTDKRFHIIGFGKAVASMATVLQVTLQSHIRSGVLSVPVHSEADVTPPILTYHGAKNNLPDLDSLLATDEILRLAGSIPPEDIVLVLISGGGSSLFCKPVSGVSLEDKLLTIRLLTEQGANIQELNIVRKTISAVKGGRLAYMLRNNHTICLILSDVIGDPLGIIASGPTVPNVDSNAAAAMKIINQYNLQHKIPQSVLNAIEYNCECFSNPNVIERVQNIVIGSNTIALHSAKRLEENEKCKIIIVCSDLSGFVTSVGEWYVKLSQLMLHILNLNDVKEFSEAMDKLLSEKNCSNSIITEILIAKENPNVETVCLLLGGETTVRLLGSGKGGRNQELAVIFANYLYRLKLASPGLFNGWSVSLLCAGTDGIDGPTDVAGAIGCVELIKQGNAIGLNVEEYLASNDSYTYLSRIEDGKYFVRTGHTGTNVMDIHILAFRRILSDRPTSKL